MSQDTTSNNTAETHELSTKDKIFNFAVDNVVTILFGIICIGGIIASQESAYTLISLLLERLTRNSFIVLALLIPVVAGMGLNFSITIGAMAGQMAMIIVAYLGIQSGLGITATFILSTPIALILGNLIGKLLNKTRGQEMIGSLITGFFADGIYQLIFLFMAGTIIPMTGEFILSSGMGLRNTIDLMRNNGIGKSVDNFVKVPFFTFLIVMLPIVAAYFIYKIVTDKKATKVTLYKRIAAIIVAAGVTTISAMITYAPHMNPQFRILGTIKLPIVTAILVILFAAFNMLILKTRLGQTLRTVGQDKHIAEVSGIKVDKIRELAIMLSTVFAAWGQIIFIQNLGVLNTYGSHKQIALFAVAALLIGGASVSKATVSQAFLGVLLFHTLFIVSPNAGKNLFGDAQMGEFFRTFVAYGVIGLSLGLYAWKKTMLKGKSS